jgi:hypothetical protein
MAAQPLNNKQVVEACYRQALSGKLGNSKGAAQSFGGANTIKELALRKVLMVIKQTEELSVVVRACGLRGEFSPVVFQGDTQLYPGALCGPMDGSMQLPQGLREQDHHAQQQHREPDGQAMGLRV